MFEGHFPGHPLMPGVLLIETMAQTAGWLVHRGAAISSACRSWPQVKEAKLRTFVDARPGAAGQRPAACTTAPATPWSTRPHHARRQDGGRRRDHLSRGAFPQRRRCAPRCWRGRARRSCRCRGARCMAEPRRRRADHRHRPRVLPRRRPRCALGGAEQRRRLRPVVDTDDASRPSRCIRWSPLELDQQIPKKGDQRQMEPWQRIGTYAAGLALDSRRREGQCRTARRAWT